MIMIQMKNLKTFLLISALFIGIIGFAACVEKRTPCRYLIPKDYVGWVQIDFEVKDAPAVTLEDGRKFFKFPSSGLIQTSSDNEYGVGSDDYYYYSGENRQQLKLPGLSSDGLIWSDGTGASSDYPYHYYHFFVGTEEQFKKCGAGNARKIGALDAETLKKCLAK